MATKLLPLPADGGGKQRSLALLRRLAAEARVTLAAFDDGHADLHGLEALGIRVVTAPWRPTARTMLAGAVRNRSLTGGRFWDAGLAAEIRAVSDADPVDALVLEFPQLEGLVRAVAAGRRVLATQNVESSLIASMGSTGSGARRLVLGLESKAIARTEARLVSTWEATAVVSEADRGRMPGAARVMLVCPNGQDPVAAFPPVPSEDVVFVAHLGWGPNIDAAVWLATEIWPAVLEVRPGARLRLVGRDPDDRVLALAGPTVEVVGTVPDVAPYLRDAALAVAPLRAGGGTRLKILEALMAGRPVVATSVGAEGLDDLVGRGVLLADDPSEFARRVVDLLSDADRRLELGTQGHDAVMAAYSWDATLAPLVDVILHG